MQKSLIKRLRKKLLWLNGSQRTKTRPGIQRGFSALSQIPNCQKTLSIHLRGIFRS